SIGGSNTLRIRAEPSLNGRILGELEPGAGLRVLERRGSWAHMQRDAWVPTASLEAVAPVTTSSSDATTRPSTTPGNRVGALKAEDVTELRAAPSSDVVARIEPGTIVETVARERGWVRVRLEAWVA